MGIFKNKKGYEGEFKNLLFAFILFALFGMLILIAVNEVGNSYSKDTSEITGGSLSLQIFNDSISGVTEEAQTLKAQYEKRSTWTQIAGITLVGIFPLAIKMFELIFLPFIVLSNIMIDVIGIPAFVSNIILGIFILSIIFAIWRLLKIGE